MGRAQTRKEGDQELDDDGADQLANWLTDGYPAAYRTAFLILHDRRDAEEAVQEAFLRAWRFRAAVPPGDGVRPWMYRVVVNACLSKLRAERNWRERTFTVDDIGATGPDRRAAPPAEPDLVALAGETQVALIRAMADLPDHLRVVIVLRYYAQLSEKEIASVIHRRPGTVKSRIHEAKLLLSKAPGLDSYRPVAAAVADGTNDD